MDHLAAFQLPRQDQSDSFLFNSLPAEVRDKIFSFVLNCYENPKKLWSKDTPYVRPGHSAAQVADIALLQTCQRIYAENWFRSWTSATHTFYLTAAERRPCENEITTAEDFQPRLDRLFAAHGEVEISHVQVFAQMYNLDPYNSALIPILAMNHFFPRKLTVTIRHHDWWWWESDCRLRIKAAWLEDCRFPDSLTEVCLELESLERKKNQIDWIANGMVEHWHLEKVDGTFMSASIEDCKVSNWSGSSTWEQSRWIRDETKPGINEYYVKTVTFRPNKEIRTRPPQPPILEVPDSFPELTGRYVSFSVSELEQAGIPADLPADETLRRMQELRVGDSDWASGSDGDEDQIDDSEFDEAYERDEDDLSTRSEDGSDGDDETDEDETNDENNELS